MIQRIKTFEETEYFWLIPSAIDLPTILSKHPPAFKGYKIHYFYHIIDTICDRMEFIDFNDETQWVHLSSKILEDFNPKYKLYLHYLIQVGILDYNPSYEVGERCKGFRISPTYYDGTPVYVQLTNKDFIIWKKQKHLSSLRIKRKRL